MNEHLKIHDIKPIVEIPDMSIYLYYGLWIIACLVVLFLGYFLFRWIEKRKHSEYRQYKNILQSIEFKNPKQDAYTISKYGRLVAKSERSQRLIEEIHKQLDVYKYKKVVDKKISQEIRTQFEVFMESLDD